MALTLRQLDEILRLYVYPPSSPTVVESDPIVDTEE